MTLDATKLFILCKILKTSYVVLQITVKSFLVQVIKYKSVTPTEWTKDRYWINYWDQLICSSKWRRIEMLINTETISVNEWKWMNERVKRMSRRGKSDGASGFNGLWRDPVIYINTIDWRSGLKLFFPFWMSLYCEIEIRKNKSIRVYKSTHIYQKKIKKIGIL